MSCDGCRLQVRGLVNQSITFQNWHSLGLGDLPKGLPLRVTGGNSDPNPQQGSPRLNTVWYTNFNTGPGSVSPENFTKPEKFCIPVGARDAESFFGVRPAAAHTSDAHFHTRAHALLEKVHATPDMQRAATKVPRAAFRGHDFASMGRHSIA
jgi:hypothetical protein